MLRSTVETLPEDIRLELEKRLIQNSFSGYSEMSEWLAEQGFEISRSAVWRHGKKFEDRLRALKIATDQAKAIAEASEDDAGSLNDAIIRLVQTKMFDLLMDLDTEDKNLPKIGQAVAKLSQAAVSQKKWKQEMSEKIKAQAASAVEKEAKRQGASADTIDKLREAIMKGLE